MSQTPDTEKPAELTSSSKGWRRWRQSKSGQTAKPSAEKARPGQHKALKPSGTHNLETLEEATSKRPRPMSAGESTTPEDAGRAPEDAAIFQKAVHQVRSPSQRQDSPPYSSSEEGLMNKKTRDLSIDDGRGPQRSSSNLNEKKRSGQDSQSPHESKRTRHSQVPKHAPDHRYDSTESHDATRHQCQSSKSAKALEPNFLADLSKPRPSPGRTSSPTDQGGGDSGDCDITMLLQPETRPITQEQLVNEVKGIYAGLVMVEKKCVEICAQQTSNSNKDLSNEQWQALIALHRTLLHEHHDFFLASQHPTASAALRRLATKYAMPARMWRHGIHSFLELLRNRLPESLDHMLSFVYLAYSMMALLMESVPSFVETWIECLGDLARYRMAIEEADFRDRDIWSNVARMWYNKAADRSPNVGRIQHHLAVLARPNVVQQLFYYSKALVSVVPFVNARDSIMLLFTPFLEKGDITYSKYPALESSLVTAFGILFTKGSIRDFTAHAEDFLNNLDSHISRNPVKWKIQGPEVASSLIAGIFDYGADDNYLWKLIRSHAETIRATQDADQGTKQESMEHKAPGNVASDVVLDPKVMDKLRREYWTQLAQESSSHPEGLDPIDVDEDSMFSTADVTRSVLPVWSRATTTIVSRLGDRNITPYVHLTLAFLWSMSFIPGALVVLETYVPWSKLVIYLNTLGRSSVSEARVESTEFPDTMSGVGPQLPEDFPIRGLAWAQFLYPSDFFTKNVVDEDERTLELPSHAAPRSERCLWLGVRIASLGRYMTYNVETKQFAVTDFALSLAESKHTLGSKSTTGSVESEFDAVMVNAA